ncbi:hypothetical protein ACN2C0_00345 [Aliarcobacter butzleri]|uniref:hypothetical protein n=2 Tax=Aliarcobacter butzleri TaxID=28197 RepID=UPI0021B1E246|nr:hypothetical protein [Aliarcobacter butzleri]MCT7560790.1 hypothetical protein [Aliarcobacter butzleri]MCT7627305.1 hypothetical protein [Aliarcobacter butzleri]UWY61300.1 hypothetical protein N3115_05530 [Aliarcobacter butzleri]
MISVDNNAEKRVFHLTEKENETDFISYKKEIIKAIYHKNYRKLNILKHNSYNAQFSVFIFHDKIINNINSMLNSNLKTKLLELNWYEVLIGSIEDIRKLIRDNKFLIINTLYKETNTHFKDYKKNFENLYNNELSGKDELKKQFFNLFEDLNVCPYCNRNFVNPIYKEKAVEEGKDYKKWSPDIEHFFPKSIYPFLSLSISNLLPSCTFCNKIKHDIDTYKHNCLSPYEIKNSDFRFDFTLNINQVKEVKLICKNKDCKNSEILHLESLYNEVHSKYINDIFENDLKYTQRNKDFLDKFKILTEEDYKKVFRNYYKEEDFNKQPLSKMTKDLYNQITNLKSK